MNTASLDTLLAPHLDAAVRGDRDAYGRVVARCQNSVTAIALAIVRDVPASEDIAQEAFLTAWQQLRKLNNPASFLPWLRQITRNLARDHLRAQRLRANPVDDVDAVIAQVADPQPDPAERHADEEQQAIAANVIDELPEESREVLLLYYREGQSSKQVAELLGLSDAAVRKRLSRARQAIRDELLARIGAFARDSAPSAIFTLTVLTALTTASPAAAAASVLTTTAGVAAGKTFGKVLLGSAGAVGLAMTVAFAGMFFELRRKLRGAIDARERRELTVSTMICGGAALLYLLGILTAVAWTDGWQVPIALTLVFCAVVFWQEMVVQPKAMRRRHAIEAAQDPVAAARRRRRERIIRWAGASTGTLIACGALAYALISSGRL